MRIVKNHNKTLAGTIFKLHELKIFNKRDLHNFFFVFSVGGNESMEKFFSEIEMQKRRIDRTWFEVNLNLRYKV